MTSQPRRMGRPAPADAARESGDAREKRERTLYEIASIFFAAIVVLFAVAGMLRRLRRPRPGVGRVRDLRALPAARIGRLWVGLKRGNEGAGDPPGG